MYDEDDVREVRGLPHGQERWGEPVRNGDADRVCAVHLIDTGVRLVATTTREHAGKTIALCAGCAQAHDWARGTAQAQSIAADSRRKADEAQATREALMRDVQSGIRVLRTRDGVPLTDDAIRERAANIVSGLVGNYRITRLDGVTFSRPVDFNDARIR